MMLLIQRVQDLAVSQHVVQALAGIYPRLVRQSQRELPDGPELLHLPAVLVQPRLGGTSAHPLLP
jgi:hypothetical protein